MKQGEYPDDKVLHGGLYQNQECRHWTNPIQTMQLYLVTFRCSSSYCWAIYTARQVSVGVFSGVGLMSCVLIEQRPGHSTFKGGVVHGQVP